MKILILPSSAQAVERCAQIVSQAVVQQPALVLGLATGGTMLPLYRLLCAYYQEHKLSFAQVRTFNLDEYIGVAPEHPCSYHHYMRQVLFDQVDIDLKNTFLPKGDAVDAAQEADRYEACIAANGGVDLQLLGIGVNGHIGFNEPTSSLASRTRIKTLTKSTRDANQRYFARTEDIPRYAVTMGIATILQARHCCLLATGVEKAAAVRGMVEGPVAAVCPASVLQMHPKTTVVLDQDAAAELQFRHYYHKIHPEGTEVEVG